MIIITTTTTNYFDIRMSGNSVGSRGWCQTSLRHHRPVTRAKCSHNHVIASISLEKKIHGKIKFGKKIFLFKEGKSG